MPVRVEDGEVTSYVSDEETMSLNIHVRSSELLLPYYTLKMGNMATYLWANPVGRQPSTTPLSAIWLTGSLSRSRCYLHLPSSLPRMLTAFGSGRPSTICLRVPSVRPKDRRKHQPFFWLAWPPTRETIPLARCSFRS